MATFDRFWFWRKWLPERHGQQCRIVARGKLNSALIEFADGWQVVSSRWAIRKLPEGTIAAGDDSAGGSPGPHVTPGVAAVRRQ